VYDCSRYSAVIDPAQSSIGTTVSTNSEKPVLSDLTGHYAQELHKFDFRRFWHSLVERIWIVAICVLAGLFLALGYLARTPKLYQGHTVLEVEFQEPTFLPTDDATTRMRSMFLASQEALRTIEQNLTNQTLLSRVVRSEGLAADGGRALLGQSVVPDKKSSPAPRTETPQPGTKANPGGGTTFTPLEEGLGRAMAGMVRPTIRRGTRLIDLYVTHPDPVMAQRLAEAIGREYIRNSIERRASLSEEALRYLLEEEERLKTNLQKSEAAVADYKASHPDALQLGGGTAATGSQQGSGAGGGPRGGLVEDKLQDLNNKLTGAKADRIRLEGELKQIQQDGDNIEALLEVPSIASAPMVTEARRTVTQIEAAITTYALRYKDKHPKMIAAKASLADAKDKLRQAVLAQPAILRNAIEQTKVTEDSLQNALHDQQGVAVALNRTAIGWQELARQAETDRALYESVIRQIKETSLSKDVKANAVSVIEHSPLPQSPVSPRPTRTIFLGLLGGLVVGLAFVFGADALDRSIKTVDQAESTVGLPVFAAIPETTDEGPVSRLKRRGKRAFGSSTYRVVVETPESPAAEAFRNLRAALALLGPEAERKVSLFTSAVPNEGKSFTSANYSLALAQQGYRVLLIDGDLRRPTMHKIFRFPSAKNNSDEDCEPGVIDCLLSEADVAAAARQIPAGEIQIVDENIAVTGNILTATGGQLSVLAGGRRSPNPAEILAGPFFGRLIAEASVLFDRVVIDSAPILAVSDTLLMTPHVQTLCIVVRAAKTPRQAVRRAISLLAKSGIRPAGLVLNRLRRSGGVGYYYHYSTHGYGKEEGAYSRSYGRRHTSYHEGNGAEV
jgi:succinoglycan biosynthesis transport protein ExoP